MLEISEYLKLRERPERAPVMFQRWRSLAFLHFPCDPAEIQALLPPGLTVDTFPDPETGIERAWVGLVPFRMEAVRPRGLPAVRPLSFFPETNVRTYAHFEGKEPGVWFFSLEAASPTACRIARRFFGLPYHESAMQVVDLPGGGRSYASRRLSNGAVANLAVTPGEPQGAAEPGTLDFWLAERYLLYSVQGGRLMKGRVHHEPYQLESISVAGLEETLIVAAGIAPRPFTHRVGSPGVEVSVYPVEPVK